MKLHTDFYLQSKEINGTTIRFRKCSSCGVKLLENEDNPYFNLVCRVASEREKNAIDRIKEQL